MGDTPLFLKYPRLFSLSLQKEATVRELLGNEGDGSVWNLIWRRRLFQWEEDSVLSLLASLANVPLSLQDDKWWWYCDAAGCFSVNLAYESLSKELADPPSLTPFEENVFAKIWDSPAQSKVIAFSWQLLHDCIPSKVNLLSRGLLHQPGGGICDWCCEASESSLHLFLHCKVAMVVWYEIFKWCGAKQSHFQRRCF
jgi:hypothetical protein